MKRQNEYLMSNEKLVSKKRKFNKSYDNSIISYDNSKIINA